MTRAWLVQSNSHIVRNCYLAFVDDDHDDDNNGWLGLLVDGWERDGTGYIYLYTTWSLYMSHGRWSVAV